MLIIAAAVCEPGSHTSKSDPLLPSLAITFGFVWAIPASTNFTAWLRVWLSCLFLLEPTLWVLERFKQKSHTLKCYVLQNKIWQTKTVSLLWGSLESSLENFNTKEKESNLVVISPNNIKEIYMLNRLRYLQKYLEIALIFFYIFWKLASNFSPFHANKGKNSSSMLL